MTLKQILEKKAAATAQKPEGIRITPESEHALRSAAIKATLDATAPKAPAPAPRELGAMEPGERVPMDHPAPGSPDADWVWFDSLHSFETDLGIVIEPDGGNAWLAIRYQPGKPPALLHRFPIIALPNANNPF